VLQTQLRKLQHNLMYSPGVTEAPTRKTVPLTSAEASTIEQARTKGTPFHAALTELVGEDAARSEAATLHALVAYGLQALGEQVALDAYAKLAESRDAEDEEYSAVLRRRDRDRS
jgi:hypothetical protein